MSTLTALLARAAVDLSDAANDTWSSAELTDHLRRTLREIDLLAPRPTTATLTPDEGSRELSLASLGGIVALLDLWYPYDADEPAHPPERPAWRWLTADSIWLAVEAPPDGVLQARLLYGAPHTVDGLDGASLTTLDAYGEQLLVLGTTASAAEQLSLARTGAITVTTNTPHQLAEWARARRKRFEQGLERLAARRRLSPEARVAWNAEV